MHGSDLSEGPVAVPRKLVARANIALKRRRPGERSAERPVWILDGMPARIL